MKNYWVMILVLVVIPSELHYITKEREKFEAVVETLMKTFSFSANFFTFKHVTFLLDEAVIEMGMHGQCSFLCVQPRTVCPSSSLISQTSVMFLPIQRVGATPNEKLRSLVLLHLIHQSHHLGEKTRISSSRVVGGIISSR